jgi:hypothetical protein
MIDSLLAADRARSLLQCQSSPPAGRRARPRDHLVSARSETAPFELPARRETGLYFAGDYNLRGRTPKADVDVCFNGNIVVSQVKLL